MEQTSFSLQEFFIGLFNFIDLLYLVVFMFAAYINKGWIYKALCKAFYKKSVANPSMNWVVALIGIMVALIFWFIPDIRTSGVYFKLDGSVRNVYAVKLFVTYAVGTTFHDTIVSQLQGFYKRWTNKLSNDQDNGSTTV
jgi:hypothetical protein